MKALYALRRFYALSRLIHIYLSTALFALLVLFCITGLLLNHGDWLSSSHKDDERSLVIPVELANTLANQHNGDWKPPIDKLQDLISQQAPHLGEPSAINIDKEAEEILFDYQLPAGYALVIFNADGAQLEYSKGHWLSIMNDLHKGRHSGGSWSWVIDLSAVLIVLFAITGMIILIQNRKRRTLGFLLSIFGLCTPLVIYFLFVPRL